MLVLVDASPLVPTCPKSIPRKSSSNPKFVFGLSKSGNPFNEIDSSSTLDDDATECSDKRYLILLSNSFSVANVVREKL